MGWEVSKMEHEESGRMGRMILQALSKLLHVSSFSSWSWNPGTGGMTVVTSEGMYQVFGWNGI